jgi:hypothetical protein
MHKRIAGSLATLAVIGAMALPAAAGSKISVPVYVNQQYREVIGSPADTRAVGPAGAIIRMHVVAMPSWRMGYVWANDGLGQSAYCYTYDANLIEAMQSVGSDDGFWVYWNPDGTCSSVERIMGSDYSPKVP